MTWACPILERINHLVCLGVADSGFPMDGDEGIVVGFVEMDHPDPMKFGASLGVFGNAGRNDKFPTVVDDAVVDSIIDEEDVHL